MYEWSVFTLTISAKANQSFLKARILHLYIGMLPIVLAQSIHFENLNTIIYTKIQKKSMIAACYGSNYYTRGASILSQIFLKS